MTRSRKSAAAATGGPTTSQAAGLAGGAAAAQAPGEGRDPRAAAGVADAPGIAAPSGAATAVAAAAGAPDPVDLAELVFGDVLPLAARYAAWLANAGVERGLIGPREVPRLWERHLLNCAVVGELLHARERVVDVGSGAGLPGIPLALVRPDCTYVLLEPLQRRAAFLTEVVADLGLESYVSVLRARAEEVARSGETYDVAVARAVAPLDRLAAWCLPLVRPGGRVLALKGERAAGEVAAAPHLYAQIATAGDNFGGAPTTVVTMTRPSSQGTTSRRKGRS